MSSIDRHAVELWEAEDALATAYSVRIEVRWAILGATEFGRILFVVFTERAGKFRVVTARDAEYKEKRRYRRG